MVVAANVLFVLTGLLIVIQMVVVMRYAGRMSHRKSADHDPVYQPKVAVVLCLRGLDPSLKQCLDAITSQTYPNYRLICVFDSENDPAYPMIESVSNDASINSIPITILVAKPQQRDRSLKCNSLVAAFEAVAEPVTVLVDADTIPDKNWLSDLVSPLNDEQVVATSGNRWFVPMDNGIGSFVRYLWNMAAAPQMDLYQVTWGGSLALRSSFVRSSGLLDAWSKSLFEDCSVPRFARKKGKRVEMLPRLLVPNRESVSTGDATRWVKRQLLDTRLYHTCFPRVVLHCFSVLALTGFALLLLSLMIFSEEFLKPLIVVGMCFVNYAVFYLCAWLILEKSARDALIGRGHKLSRHPLLSPQAWIAVVVTQVAYTIATWKAIRTKRVTWRGIDYEVRAPESIEMVEYHEMESTAKGSTTSL